MKKHPPSSFHMPLRFLAPAKSRAMKILYDFCRAADDAADSGREDTYAYAQLKVLRDQIYLAFSGLTPYEPLNAVIQKYSLKAGYFYALLDGMGMDISGQMVRPSLETLTLYCYRVAGCVGLLSLPIFGCAGSQAEAFAIALGYALQLTNILRDVKEDAAHGRLYLPIELLEEMGIGHIQPENICEHNEAVQLVCIKLAEKAEEYFSEAEQLSHYCNRRKLLPALLMRDVYYYYLSSMKKQGSFLDAPNPRLGFSYKISIILKAVRYLF
jgi:phytoene/squalene synthetase